MNIICWSAITKLLFHPYWGSFLNRESGHGFVAAITHASRWSLQNLIDDADGEADTGHFYVSPDTAVVVQFK